MNAILLPQRVVQQAKVPIDNARGIIGIDGADDLTADVMFGPSWHVSAEKGLTRQVQETRLFNSAARPSSSFQDP
jgi:hypothetical protein